MSELVSERPIALNFPEYARIVQTDVALSDMSIRTISVTVKIDGDITPDFSYDWKMSFRGQVYILPIRDPQAVKENISTLSEYDLTFTHEAIYKLQGEYYIGLDTQSNLWDKYDVPINLTLPEFVAEYDKVLVHLFGGSIRAQLNPDSIISEQLYVAITNVYMWDLLQQVYEIFGCRWYFAYNTDTEVHTIKFDYPSVELSHIFQYGYEGGLLNITKGVQSPEIYNYVLGRGGSQNTPYRYFKDTDENNPLYRKDPDWVEELALVYFSELRSKEYRDYVQGYKVRKKEQGMYSDYERIYESTGRSEAYYKGYQDAGAGVFDPIEYVINEESIDKYGVRKVKLANNEEAYPSIQGVVLEGLGRVDEVVDVEQVLTDEALSNPTTISSEYVFGYPNYKIGANATLEYTLDDSIQPSNGAVIELIAGDSFQVTILQTGQYYIQGTNTPLGDYNRGGGTIYTGDNKPALVTNELYLIDSNGLSIQMENIVSDNDDEFVFQCDILKSDLYTIKRIALTEILEKPSFVVEPYTENHRYSYGEELIWKIQHLDLYKSTFDIWLKNLWRTNKLESETDEEYVSRVWTDILGEDNEEASVSFNSSTFLRGTDLEFVIVQDGVYYDTSKTITHKDKDGNITASYPSEWRLTLQKSTTEVENGGLPIPNTGEQGQAGDLFFFTGIELPQQYVEWGETKVQDAKFEYMETSAQIQPSWSVSLDQVRAEESSDDAARMIDSLDAGAMFRLYDEQLIDGSHFLNIYLQSITMSWGETDLIPETSFTLSQDVTPVINPVSALQGEVETLKSTVVGTGDIQKEVRKVGDLMYLLKNGTPDISASPTTFKKVVKHADALQSEDYRQGAISGAGWSLENRNGRSTLEVDDAVFRGNVSYNNIIINQIAVVGGKTIECAARMECSRVEETEDAYICYFDQKQGSVANMFQVDDVAYSSIYNAENIEIKSYKRKVVARDVNSITLSKAITNGDGVPSEQDIICHFGNYTNRDRQYVIVRDIIGGGNEKMISELNSVAADGYIYKFTGVETGQFPREQLGDEQRGGYRAILGEDGSIEYIGWFNKVVFKSPNPEQSDVTSDDLIEFSNGKIKASAIDVDNLIARKIQTSESGERIQMLDDTMRIFDEAGEEKLLIDGTQYDTHDEVLDTSHTPTIVNDGELPYTYTQTILKANPNLNYSTRIPLGSFNIPKEGLHEVRVPALKFSFRSYESAVNPPFGMSGYYGYIHASLKCDGVFQDVAFGIPGSAGGIIANPNSEFTFSNQSVPVTVSRTTEGMHDIYIEVSLEINPNYYPQPTGDLAVDIDIDIADSEVSSNITSVTFKNYSHLHSRGFAVIADSQKHVSILNAPGEPPIIAQDSDFHLEMWQTESGVMADGTTWIVRKSNRGYQEIQGYTPKTSTSGLLNVNYPSAFPFKSGSVPYLSLTPTESVSAAVVIYYRRSESTNTYFQVNRIYTSGTSVGSSSWGFEWRATGFWK